MADDDRITRGMAAQARTRDALLEQGHKRLGWKVGLNAPDVQSQLGIDAPVVGFLTDATELASESTHSVAGAVRVGIEPELAAHLSADLGGEPSREEVVAAIGGVGAAVEVVDVDREFDDLEAILAGNIFHRGVVFGDPDEKRAGGELTGLVAELKVNGAQEWTAAAAHGYEDLPGIVLGVARRLHEAGETLHAGDRVIAGSLTPIQWISPGDELEVDFGRLGALRLSFTP